MLLSLAILDAVVAICEALDIVAPGVKRGLDWTDHVAMLIPIAAAAVLAASFILLPWFATLVLSLVLVVAVLWSLIALLRVPVRKRTN